jgi:hypothetical protein
MRIRKETNQHEANMVLNHLSASLYIRNNRLTVILTNKTNELKSSGS